MTAQKPSSDFSGFLLVRGVGASRVSGFGFSV